MEPKVPEDIYKSHLEPNSKYYFEVYFEKFSGMQNFEVVFWHHNIMQFSSHDSE